MHLEETTPPPSLCKFCNEEFTPVRKWQEFCSVKCRNNFHNDKRLIGAGVPIIKCPHCLTDDHKMFELLWPKHYLCNVCCKEFDNGH